MKIFVVNCGSSSIKYQLINMEDESVIAKAGRTYRYRWFCPDPHAGRQG